MKLCRLDPYRILGGAIAFFALMLPWYVRLDGQFSISLWDLLQLNSSFSVMDLAIVLFLIGVLFTFLTENGSNLLIMAFIAVTLLLEEHRLYHLQSSYDWGVGFYLAIMALGVSNARPVVEAIRDRLKRRRSKAAG